MEAQPKARENRRKKIATMAQILLLCIVDAAVAYPTDFKNMHKPFTETHRRIFKRSPDPLEVGLVTFNVAPSHTRHAFDYPDHSSFSHSSYHITNDIPAELSTSSVRVPSSQRGPSVAQGSAMNFVGLGAVETHHDSKESKSPEHIILYFPGSDHQHPEIVPQKIAFIHGALSHAISSARKTSVTTKVGHVFSGEHNKLVPVITHDITHTSHDISHDAGDHHLVTNSHQGVVVPVSGGKLLLVERVGSTTDIHGTQVSQKTAHSDDAALRGSDDDKPRKLRERVGGFGVGLSFGGQGAGHGYYVKK